MNMLERLNRNKSSGWQIYFSINMKSSIKIELANRELGTNLALTFGQLENYDCGKGQYVAGVLRGTIQTKVLPKIMFNKFRVRS